MVKLLTACVTGKLQKGWQALVWNDTEKNNSPGKMLWLDLNQKKKSVLAFNKPYQSSCITNTSTCFKRDAPQLTVWWQVCVWKTRQITEEHCSFHLKDSRRIQMITHTFSHSANIICCSCNVTTPLTLSFNNLLGQHQQQLWMAKWILMTCVCMQLREGWKKKKFKKKNHFSKWPHGPMFSWYTGRLLWYVLPMMGERDRERNRPHNWRKENVFPRSEQLLEASGVVDPCKAAFAKSSLRYPQVHPPECQAALVDIQSHMSALVSSSLSLLSHSVTISLPPPSPVFLLLLSSIRPPFGELCPPSISLGPTNLLVPPLLPLLMFMPPHPISLLLPLHRGEEEEAARGA